MPFLAGWQVPEATAPRPSLEHRLLFRVCPGVVVKGHQRGGQTGSPSWGRGGPLPAPKGPRLGPRASASGPKLMRWQVHCRSAPPAGAPEAPGMDTGTEGEVRSSPGRGQRQGPRNGLVLSQASQKTCGAIRTVTCVPPHRPGPCTPKSRGSWGAVSRLKLAVRGPQDCGHSGVCEVGLGHSDAACISWWTCLFNKTPQHMQGGERLPEGPGTGCLALEGGGMG